jgi:hypothetical protein
MATAFFVLELKSERSNLNSPPHMGLRARLVLFNFAKKEKREREARGSFLSHMTIGVAAAAAAAPR